MPYDFSRHKLLTRRTVFLSALQLGAYGFLLGRLGYLQILKGDEYQKRSDANRVSLRFTPPKRGLVLDKRQKLLIANRPSFDVIFSPDEAKNPERVLRNLDTLLKFDEVRKEKIKKEMRRLYGGRRIVVAQHLDWKMLAKIEARMPHLPGVEVEERQERYYPLAKAASMLTGYVALPSERDKMRDDYARILPDLYVGKNGLEREYNQILYGTPGFKRLEVNAKGQRVKVLEKQEPISGKAIYTNIDGRLQNYLYQTLSSYKSGSAIVLDIKTGAVLGLASYPFYDANAMVKGLSHKAWEALKKEPGDAMMNKAIAGQYPPASIFKLVVAIAAIEAGLNPRNKIHCAGHLYLGSHKFHCWKGDGHGPLSLEGALERSCDVYFYHIARRIGIDKIAAVARKLGFGECTGIDLPGEKKGLVPDRLWKKKRFGLPWYPGDSMNAGIGQGYLLATPLQIAVMLARIVSGGKKIIPTLNQDLLKNSTEAFEQIDLSKKSLVFVRRALVRAMNNPEGTGYNTRLMGAYKMGGKSGTAQVRRISKKEREQGRIFSKYKKWHYQDHALFTAFAPTKNPRYAVAVVLEHAGWGGRVAGPVARDILQKCFELKV